MKKFTFILIISCCLQIQAKDNNTHEIINNDTHLKMLGGGA